MLEVVAALIWQGNAFLICQRPQGKHLELLWEFVGGKVEPGETKAQALVREVQEELGMTVSVTREFMQVTHAYADKTIHLTVFCATITQGQPQLLEHHAMRWIGVDEMEAYDFCPADDAILQQIKAEFGVN